MAVVLETLTPEQVASFRQGNEGAFERVVKTRFDHLCDRATMALPAEASAGAARVAIGALHAAWAQHDRFADGTGLDAFLEEAVEHAAKEEVRRRASLHRFERHEGVVHEAHTVTRPSAEEVWADIHASMHVSDADRRRHREEALLEARRHAREHVDRVAKRKIPWLPIGVGLVLTVVIVGFMQWMDGASGESRLAQAIEAPNARVLGTGAGQFGSVTLNDESVARLGAATQLRMPAEFPQPARGVRLTGAARFEVAPGLEDAFQVRAGPVRVVATGTAFAVRRYADETAVVVRVDEGSVDVWHTGGGETRSVAAGSAVVVAGDGTITEATPAQLRDAFSWLEGRIVFAERPLGEVVPALARWFDLDVSLADEALADRPISAELMLDSSGKALDAVMAAGNLRLEFDAKDKMVLHAAD